MEGSGLKKRKVALHDGNENSSIEAVLLNDAGDYEANENLASFIIFLHGFSLDAVPAIDASKG